MHSPFALIAACVTLLVPAGLPTRAQAPPPAASQSRPAAHPGYILPDGSVRIVGSKDLEPVILKLDDLYTRLHPGTRFTFINANNLAATYALEFDSSAFAPLTSFFGGSATYADIARGPAFSIRMAHGSLQPKAALSPFVIVVNPANPITHLTLTELASIFTQPMRQRVISHWDQLPQRATLSTTVISCGLPWSDHFASEDPSFGEEIFTRKFAGAPPVATYKSFPTYAEAAHFVASTSGAISIIPANQADASVKVIGIVDSPFGKPQTGTAAEIAAGHYPLDRSAYINAHAVTGKPLDPIVLDYLRMVLSPEGQQVIASESTQYIPLSPAELQEELAKFE